MSHARDVCGRSRGRSNEASRKHRHKDLDRRYREDFRNDRHRVSTIDRGRSSSGSDSSPDIRKYKSRIESPDRDSRRSKELLRFMILTHLDDYLCRKARKCRHDSRSRSRSRQRHDSRSRSSSRSPRRDDSRTRSRSRRQHDSRSRSRSRRRRHDSRSRSRSRRRRHDSRSRSRSPQRHDEKSSLHVRKDSKETPVSNDHQQINNSPCVPSNPRERNNGIAARERQQIIKVSEQAPAGLLVRDSFSVGAKPDVTADRY